MNITEKLRRLTEDQNKASIARKAGLKPTQLNDYTSTSKGFKPRYDIALRIGKALGVSIEWLMDDEADWPPPNLSGKVSPANFTDQELMYEVAKRWRTAEVAVLDALDAAEKINWFEVGRAAEGWREGAPVPAEVSKVELLILSLEAGFIRAGLVFSPEQVARKHHGDMPGSHRPVTAFAEILERVIGLRMTPGFRAARKVFLGDRSTIDLQKDAAIMEVLEGLRKPKPPKQGEPTASSASQPEVSTSPQQKPKIKPHAIQPVRSRRSLE